MKSLKTPPYPMLLTPQVAQRFRTHRYNAVVLLALLGSLLATGNAARGQTPVNQLHFGFTDAPGGTTTTSDTSLNPGAIVVTATMYNALSGLNPIDLHGP